MTQGVRGGRRVTCQASRARLCVGPAAVAVAHAQDATSSSSQYRQYARCTPEEKGRVHPVGSPATARNRSQAVTAVALVMERHGRGGLRSRIRDPRALPLPRATRTPQAGPTVGSSSAVDGAVNPHVPGPRRTQRRGPQPVSEKARASRTGRPRHRPEHGGPQERRGRARRRLPDPHNGLRRGNPGYHAGLPEQPRRRRTHRRCRSSSTPASHRSRRPPFAQWCPLPASIPAHAWPRRSLTSVLLSRQSIRRPEEHPAVSSVISDHTKRAHLNQQPGRLEEPGVHSSRATEAKAT